MVKVIKSPILQIRKTRGGFSQRSIKVQRVRPASKFLSLRYGHGPRRSDGQPKKFQ